MLKQTCIEDIMCDVTPRGFTKVKNITPVFISYSNSVFYLNIIHA